MPIKTIEEVGINLKEKDGSPKTKNIPNVGDLYELWVKCTDGSTGISMAKTTEPFYATPGTKDTRWMTVQNGTTNRGMP